MDSERLWCLLSQNHSILNLSEFFHYEKYRDDAMLGNLPLTHCGRVTQYGDGSMLCKNTTCCRRHIASLGHNGLKEGFPTLRHLDMEKWQDYWHICVENSANKWLYIYLVSVMVMHIMYCNMILKYSSVGNIHRMNLNHALILLTIVRYFLQSICCHVQFSIARPNFAIILINRWYYNSYKILFSSRGVCIGRLAFTLNSPGKGYT